MWSSPGLLYINDSPNSSEKLSFRIVHFTVVCLVAKPLNRSEAKGDHVMIQTLLLFKCKLL